MATTRAVIARAYYSAKRERLRQFGDHLATGMIESQRTDGAVVLLRNWLLQTSKGREGQTSKATRQKTYLVTEYVLEAFLESRRIVQLNEVGEEKFPLPDLKNYQEIESS